MHRSGLGATHALDLGTLLSEVGAVHGCLEISGYEMLKAFAGISTHEVTVRVEVFLTRRTCLILRAGWRSACATPVVLH